MDRSYGIAIVIVATVALGSQSVRLFQRVTAERYTLQLEALNSHLTDHRVSGRATLIRDGDALRIAVKAEGLATGGHLLLLTGFPGDTPARCPTAADDQNDDGLIDALEARDASGDLAIPLAREPLSFEMDPEGFPLAGGRDGKMQYQQLVSFAALEKVVRTKLGLEELALDRMVLIIYGVAEPSGVPRTAGTLPGLPAHQTVPLACGTLSQGR